jgi:hypothetical protein
VRTKTGYRGLTPPANFGLALRAKSGDEIESGIISTKTGYRGLMHPAADLGLALRAKSGDEIESGIIIRGVVER